MAILTQAARPAPDQQRGRDRVSVLCAISDGVAGVKETLDRMIRMARAASLTDSVRIAAEDITRYVNGKDYAGQVRAVQEWVKSNIRYLRDHATAETLIDPVLLLQSRAGDCDDHAMLVAALLTTIGFKCRFIAIGADDPNVFDHVYTEVRLGAGWISVETTEPVEIGWQPEYVARMARHL